MSVASISRSLFLSISHRCLQLFNIFLFYPNPTVLIDAIKEVRIGKNTDTFRARESTMEFPEDCAFSVIFGDHFETLDLVASSADEANIWVTGLSYLTGGKKNKCK